MRRTYVVDEATTVLDEADMGTRRMRRLLGLTSLWWLENLCRKGLGRVRLKVLTSLQPHFNLTRTSFWFIWIAKCLLLGAKNLQPQKICCTFALKKWERTSMETFGTKCSQQWDWMPSVPVSMLRWNRRWVRARWTDALSMVARSDKNITKMMVRQLKTQWRKGWSQNVSRVKTHADRYKKNETTIPKVNDLQQIVPVKDYYKAIIIV